MKKIITALSIALISGSVYAQPCINPSYFLYELNKYNKSEKDNYFFIQNSEKLDIKTTPDPNTYRITLNNVIHEVFYVSARPNRVSGSINMNKFLNVWNRIGRNSFKKTPPNAIISGFPDKLNSSKCFNIAFELTEPKYDKENNTLSYTAIALKGSSPIMKDISIENVSVFIDDVCLKCWKP